MAAMAPLDDLLNDVFQDDALLRAVLSKPRSTELPRKVTVEPVDLRGETAFQFTTQLADRATHENLAADEARERLGLLLADYGQGLLQTADADWQVLGETVLRRPPTRTAAPRDHDRRKQYLLEEGTPVPFLVELGVMTPDGKVRKSRYDKFRQVNRFLELVDDVVPSLRPEGTLRVVDFGCGKSYLTFAIHHLLTELRGREVEIVGLDLKEDVIAACSSLASPLRHGGTPLRAGRDRRLRRRREGRPRRQPARLRHSHRRGAGAGGPLAGGRDPGGSVLPEGGVPADRELAARAAPPARARQGALAALVTDTLRAQLLELSGYRTQLVEFVPLEHTAKNVLIRAVKGAPAGAETRRAYEELRDSLGLDPALERLLSAA